jgi:hypothetical protein
MCSRRGIRFSVHGQSDQPAHPASVVALEANPEGIDSIQGEQMLGEWNQPVPGPAFTVIEQLPMLVVDGARAVFSDVAPQHGIRDADGFRLASTRSAIQTSLRRS